MVDQKIIDAHIKKELSKDRKTENVGSLLRQIILGGQDGLVNVLGVIFGVAVATQNTKVAIIAGLAAAFAESISMAAVAYTSRKAEKDHYFAEFEHEQWEIKNMPEVEREEIKVIYMQKGFRGRQLEDLVDKVCSNEEMWLEVMMDEELGLAGLDKINPVNEGIIVGVSALIGSLIPLIPFFFLPMQQAIFGSILVSAITLFVAGYVKAKLTIGNPIYAGFELVAIGMIAAFIGYVIGYLLGQYFLGNPHALAG
ncbi:VIT family protein [Candidatus Gugararchaeum adminiculabundum]|nr:VIT family protein [Candidatus Gugararchaeum adminiculabundum]